MKYALLLVPVLFLAGCAREQPLPTYGQVPRFTLTSQTGQRFDSGALAGKVWVADFIFTTCPGPCPRMSSQMHSLAKELKQLPNVRFVSFTVDPEHDTPEVLAAYAKNFQADDRWYFLTGGQPELQHLDRDVFKLGNVDGSMEHSTRFVLVDQRGRIRGYYDTNEPDALKPLVAGIRRLAGESE
jgi:protein SCO1/2